MYDKRLLAEVTFQFVIYSSASALVNPIRVGSSIVRLEMPILLAVTAIAGFEVYTGDITRLDAILLLLVFAALMGWTTWQSTRGSTDSFVTEIGEEMAGHEMTPHSRPPFPNWRLHWLQ
ncbi:MAG: hypothetical protein WBQ23_13920 [Bacteroidota bacterium]